MVWRGEQQRQQAHNVAQVTKGIAERFLDNLLTNKDISAEEARRRALAELPAIVGLPADVIRQLIEGKIAARVQDTSLSPLERARAALAVGNYEAVFIESAKQRVESRELAILEGTAALARFQDNPQLSWQTKALAAFQRCPRSVRGDYAARRVGSRGVVGGLCPHQSRTVCRGGTHTAPCTATAGEPVWSRAS